MDERKKGIAAAAGVGGAILAVLLLRKRVGADPNLASLSGYVEGDPNGYPDKYYRLANATVDISGIWAATTDEHGLFSIRGIEPGRRLLTISCEGYVTITTTYTFEPGREGTTGIRLMPVIDSDSDIRIDSLTVTANLTTGFVHASIKVTNYGVETGNAIIVWRAPAADYEHTTVVKVNPGQTRTLGLNLPGTYFPGPGTYELYANELSATFTLVAPVFPCPYCDMEFESQDALVIHLDEVHDITGLVGDLDDDDEITEADLEILKLYIMGHPISEISPLPEEEFLRRADVNGDGKIDVGDMIALRNLIAAQE